MNRALTNNLTVEEFFKYVDLPDDIAENIEKLLDTLAEQEKQIKRLEKRTELALEQVSFADDLLGSIDNLVNNLPSWKTGVIPDFQKAYRIICENSFFER